MQLERPASPLITYGTYPLLVLIGVGLLALTLARGLDPAGTAALYVPVALLALILLEWRRPLRPEWRMTRRSFWRRDLKYVLTNLVLVQALNAALLSAALYVAARLVPEGGAGPLTGLPVGAQVVGGLLLFDLLQYAYHRAAHRFDWMWRWHGAHHSPRQLYVVVHAVFHPIDSIIIQVVLITIVFRLSGVSSLAAVIGLMVFGLQPIVSHANLDLRFGPLNYLLVGAELHRNHHSAMPEDAGNYGAITSIWDQVFGTFVYHPERVTERLGHFDPASYPDPERFHAVLAWPFRRPKGPIGASAAEGA